MILAIGCCLYLGTGMLLGIPVYMALARFAAQGGLVKRLIVASIVSLAIWAINFYGILSWLQPLLFGGDPGNWITNPTYLPWWVAAATHLVFGWTIALLYPLGEYRPYRGSANRPPEPSSRPQSRLGRCRQRPGYLSSPEQSEETTLEKELPRHEDLVDERLVFWYFVAALTFMFVSMLGGLLMGLQLVAHQSLQRDRAVLAGPLADDPHQRDRLRLPRQRLPGDPALGRARG